MAGFSSISLSSMRLALLFSAILLYAFCGSPTPDHPGIAEIIIGVLLICSIGTNGASSLLQFSFQNGPFWHAAGQALLLYGLSVPFILGVMNGHDPGLMLRDLIPFLFFLLPLWLMPLLRRHPKAQPYFLAVLIGAGLLFSLRAIYYLLPWAWLRGLLAPDSDELFYFANAPTVLLASLALIGFAAKRIIAAKKMQDFLVPALMLAFSLLPIAAMTLAAQRASLATITLYVGVIGLISLWQNPVKAWRVLLVLICLAVAFFPDIAEITRALVYKTREVGLNMRAQEAHAVWETVSDSPQTLLFGLGWGGTFHSPAVGGVAVNFSHSLFTSYLLKTGLIGVIIMSAYIGGLLNWVVRIVLKEPVQGLALAAPVMIDVLFYASFKSLDFGLVLALVPASLLYLRENRTTWPVIEKREEADFWVLYADNRVEVCLDRASSL